MLLQHNARRRRQQQQRGEKGMGGSPATSDGLEVGVLG